MAYLTVEQIKSRASKKNINLSIYTDEELEGKISVYQRLIEERTGRIFEQRQKREWIPRFDGISYNLRHYPVLGNATVEAENPGEGPSCDSMTIDTMPVNWYYLQQEDGIIIFDMPIFNWGPYRVNNIYVTYTVVYDLDDPTGIHPEAQSLCSDMVLESVVAARNKTGINMDQFESRLKALSRPLLEVRGS